MDINNFNLLLLIKRYNLLKNNTDIILFKTILVELATVKVFCTNVVYKKTGIKNKAWKHCFKYLPHV